jgi:predicted dehydrogenase
MDDALMVNYNVSMCLPVSIGLIGVGDRLRTVVKNLLRESRGQIKVAAAYDSDPGAVSLAREQFGMAVAVSGNDRELIATPGLDWVFIGTPNCHHADQAVSALRAGLHVFCEKPLATNLSDCLRVRGAVTVSGKIFAFGLVLRYTPIYRKIKELLDAGAVGDLVSFEFNETLDFNHGGYIFGNWRRQRALAGTHILEKCCHDLDLANWFTGKLPRRVASFGGRDFFVPANERHIARIGPDDNGRAAYQTLRGPRQVNPFIGGADIFDNQVAILEYDGGARATFHTNCNTGLPERRFYWCGTEGTLRANLATGRVELARIAHTRHVEEIDCAGEAAGGHGGGDDELARGLALTLTRGLPPLAGIDEALRACAVAFAIDEAADGGRVVDLRPLWNQLGLTVSG